MFEFIPDLTDKERKQLKRNMRYWGDRAADAQARLTEKNRKQIEAQLRKYYAETSKNIIGQFEETYYKIFLRIDEGKEPTPADLYKLDTYWKMQAQLREELQKLGDKQAELFSKNFEKQWLDIYEELAVKDDLFFGEADLTTANTMINEIWCADGKAWSERVWDNINTLQQTLNDNLIDCVVAGRNPSFLKKILMQDFGASYESADMLVRTELAHIQTQAAKQRYIDAGITEVEIIADKDERQCKVCGKLHKQRFPIHGPVPIPAHPRCRCCIKPVID